jgi:transcriptional regulator with XRE-family HTH domain
MAAKLGISPSYISAIEFGNREMPEDIANRLKENYELTDDLRKEFNELVLTTQIAQATSVKFSTKGISKDKLGAMKQIYERKELKSEVFDIIQKITEPQNDDLNRKIKFILKVLTMSDEEFEDMLVKLNVELEEN